MIPSVGCIVHYKLNQFDVDEINRTRLLEGNHANGHTVGQVIPFLICNTWGDSPTEDTAVNGQGFVDGSFAVWLTSRVQGDGIGQWSDPRA